MESVFFKIILSQARYRWIFTLLLFLAMTVLVTLYVYPVSYTHLRAHETPEHLVCRLLLEKKK